MSGAYAELGGTAVPPPAPAAPKPARHVWVLKVIDPRGGAAKYVCKRCRTVRVRLTRMRTHRYPVDRFTLPDGQTLEGRVPACVPKG